MKPLALLVGLCALLFGSLMLGGQPGHAQTIAQAPPAISGPPDVLVLVYQQPGDADQVDITYAHTVPHAQVAQDITALTQATGWPISPRSIKDAAAPMERRLGAMTSIVFQAPGVVQDSSHTLPVETFARAFHTYKRLTMVFFVGPQFAFQGSRAYADHNIKVALDQRGTTYTYQIEMVNSNFGSLPLSSSSAHTVAETGHRAPWRIFLGILAAAMIVGLAVYFLTARLTPKVKLTHTDQNTDAETETRREVGTRG